MGLLIGEGWSQACTGASSRSWSTGGTAPGVRSASALSLVGLVRLGRAARRACQSAAAARMASATKATAPTLATVASPVVKASLAPARAAAEP
jgi:hypothetical protein